MQPQQQSPAPRRSFGPFEYDSAAGELLKYGNRVKLQGQPLQILELLLERAGGVVTREELQTRLWSGAPFVDSEHGLNAAVNKLRQALGDSADQPRYVETLPGRGYRFAGPLEPSKGVLQMAPTAESVPKPEVPVRPGYRTAALVALTVVGLIGTGYWVGVQKARPPARPLQFRVAPPAGFHLQQAAARAAFALSPDGTKLAFTAMDAAGKQRVFLRDLGSLEARELPGSESAHSLFWGTDARSLYVLVQGKLRRFSLGGNESVVVGNVPPFTTSGTALGPDVVMAASMWRAVLLRAPGSQPEVLPDVHAWPQSLPRGDRLVAGSTDGALWKFRARIVSVEGRKRQATELFESESRVQYAETEQGGYLLHMRSGSLVARPFDLERERLGRETLVIANPVSSFPANGAADFSASFGGTVAYLKYVSRSRLVWVDRAGKQVGAMGPADVGVQSGRISPDGTMVAAALYDVEKGARDLWLFDSTSGAGRKFSSVAGLRDAPVWSPDSRQLAYLRRVSKLPQVYFRGLEDHDQEEVLPGDGFQLPTDWSRDGRFVLYHNTGIPQVASEQQSDVWIADRSKRGAVPVPLLNTAFHEANAAFSPDAQWVAFTSNESGHAELYLQAFEAGDGKPRLTGRRYLASRAGAVAIRWRRDGRELFYLAPDGRVHAVTVKLGAEPSFGQPAALFSISAEARTALHSHIGFDVTGDGSRFLIPAVAVDKEGPSIIVSRDWDVK